MKDPNQPDPESFALGNWNPYTNSERDIILESSMRKENAKFDAMMETWKPGKVIQLTRCAECSESAPADRLWLTACCGILLCNRDKIDCDGCGEILCRHHKIEYGGLFLCRRCMKAMTATPEEVYREEDWEDEAA